MASLNSWCILNLLLFYLQLGTDGYYFHIQRECHFSSRNLQGLEFIDRYFFNKLEQGRYNSTLNKFIGFSKYGKEYEEKFNKDRPLIKAEYSNVNGSCRSYANMIYSATTLYVPEPIIIVKSVIHDSHDHASIKCSAYNFYPGGIKMTWLRDGVEVTSGVSTTPELANGNWQYQIHSHLEYTPKSGERISCKVEHPSLPKGKEVRQWDPTMSEVKRNKVIIGASGLVLGLIITIAGVVYYKKKSTGRILVPPS